MQEQVFDVQNMCSPYSDVVVTSAMNDGSSSPPLIPYEKDLITVSKEKRKSSRSFCRLPAKTLAKEESKKRGAEPIGVGSLVEEKNQLDKDVSIISSLSYINGDCSVMDHYQFSSSWFFQSVDDLPIVHGSTKNPYNADLYNQVQVRKLNRKLDVLRTENEEYANLTRKIPDYKKELFQVKSANFELKCQVTNLQSQLESRQRQALENEVLYSPDILPLDRKNEGEQVKQISINDFGVLEEELKSTKGQLTAAQEDIFGLNETLVRLNLDLQAKNSQIGKLEASRESRNFCNLELTLENQKLNQTILELQDKLDSSEKSRSNLEQSVILLKNEQESLLKSRNWYQSTCAKAQDTRNEVQSELIHVQSEIAAKSMQVEKLKIEAMQVKKILDEEREKSLQEKEDLKRQLEDLEMSLINSASEMNSLVLSEDSGHEQDEDLDMQIELLKEDINEKSYKIQELEEKVSQAEQLSACIKKDNDLINVKYARMQNEMEEMHQSKILIHEDLRAKEKFIQDLETAKVDIDAMSRQHQSQLKDLNIYWQQEKETNQSLNGKLKKCQVQVLQMEKANEKLEMSLKLCQTEVITLKKVADEMRDIRDENILLKKQCLSQDHRNIALKEAFEASDEARQVLEQAHFQLQEENKRLISAAQVSKPVEAEETALKEELKIKTNELDDALEQIKDLQKANAELKVNSDSLKERVLENQNDKDDTSMEKADLELRNSRLECSLKIYHDEMSRLTTKIVDLEEAIIVLEHKNGKLVTEQIQNAQMKRQIEKLHDDIAKDTALRQDLLSSIDMAKTSLLSEVHTLEQRLHKEKEEHASTKNKLIVLEHEMTELRVDRRSLRTGIETAELTIEKLQHQIHDHEKQKEKITGPDDHKFVLDQSKLHSQQIYEDGQRVILGLENQVTELKLQLAQRASELDKFQGILKAKEEAYTVEREELKNNSDHFRAELVSMALKMDKLSEEKKNYRTQVQDMNVALKNSLEHIKRLRTQQPLLVQTKEENFDHVLETKVGNSSEAQKSNLTNLQNCLKSLKYEMAVLHKRLAPSVPNSPSKSAIETKEK